MVLYADILFLVDLSMDFLTLYLCSRLTHRPASALRILAAAALGALGSVLLLVTDAGQSTTFWTGLLLSCIMTAAAFGIRPSARAFFRQVLLVWGSGAITGGCMSILLSLGEPVYLERSWGGQESFGPVFIGTTAVVYGLIRLLQKRMEAKSAEVVIVRQGITAKVTVLVDSGNLLTDPLTGRAVILVSGDAVNLPGLPYAETEQALACTEHMLPIPAKGVSGTRLLWGIRPDLLLVNGQPRDALIAVEAVPADHYGGCGGTCPTALL